MPQIQATTGTTTAAITGTRVTAPKIENQTIALADTEVAVVLPADTVRFQIKARGHAKLKVSYTSGESGTVYETIWPGSVFKEDNINRTSTTLYIQANIAGEVLEIRSWS